VYYFGLSENWNFGIHKTVRVTDISLRVPVICGLGKATQVLSRPARASPNFPLEVQKF